MHPRLLVSVRCPIEAEAAIHGGADVIDVKEPLHGSLGRAHLQVASEIAQRVQECASAARLSFALGEVTEWLGPLPADQRAWLPFLNDTRNAGLLKLGLAATIPAQVPQLLPASLAATTLTPTGLGDKPVDDPDSVLPWWNHWNRARQTIADNEDIRCDRDGGTAVEVTVRGTGQNAAAESRWIAVAYVDNVRCRAPGLFEIAEAAVAAHCHGLLLDTCVKDGQGLRKWCSQDDLLRVRRLTSEHGLILAVAGQIQAEDLLALAPIAPDVIAVRGSVCDRGQREMSVQTQLVRQLVQTIRSVSWNRGPGAG